MLKFTRIQSRRSNSPSRQTKIALVAGVLAAFAFTASPANAHAPGWCYNVYSGSPSAEKAICDNSGLWDLDHDINYEYKRARRNSSRSVRRYLKRSQKSWLRSRNRCRASVSCIRRKYNNRIYELQGY